MNRSSKCRECRKYENEVSKDIKQEMYRELKDTSLQVKGPIQYMEKDLHNGMMVKFQNSRDKDDIKNKPRAISER